MVKKMIAFCDAVNVYTDASINKFNNTLTTCAGYIITYQDHILDSGYKIIYNATNNYGEIYAIYMGLQAVLSKYAYMDKFINLFSDSRISIDGLKYWVKKWVRTQDQNGQFINTSAKLVANQEIFKNIITLINHYGVHLQMFHHLGHLNPSKIEDMNKFRKAFFEENRTILTDDAIREICYYNYLVDKNSRKILKDLSPAIAANYIKYDKLFTRVINQKDLTKYLELIREDEIRGTNQSYFNYK